MIHAAFFLGEFSKADEILRNQLFSNIFAKQLTAGAENFWTKMLTICAYFRGWGGSSHCLLLLTLGGGGV